MAISKIAALFLFKYAGTLEELREEWKGRIGTVPYIRKKLYIDASNPNKVDLTLEPLGDDKYSGPATIHRDMFKSMANSVKRNVDNSIEKDKLLHRYSKYNIKNLHGAFNEGEIFTDPRFRTPKNATPNELEAINRIVGLHEMDEMVAANKAVKDKGHFMLFQSHVLPEVILKEHNRVTTLPDDLKGKLSQYFNSSRRRDRTQTTLQKILPGYEQGVSQEVTEKDINYANRTYKKMLRSGYR